MSQDDEELDTALPPLSDADEAYVRDLLAALPPVPVPDDLAARLDTALRAEAGAGTGGTVLDTPPPAAATVVPLDAHRAARASRSTRIMQVAAAGLIVVAGGLAVAKLANHGNASEATSAGGAAAVPGSIEQAAVTHSGHAYTDATLVADVRSLATTRTPAPSTDSGLGAATASPGSPSTQPSASPSRTDATKTASGPTAPMFGFSTVPGPAVVACLAAVEEGMDQPVTPLAMDQGTYRGQAAFIVVLPGSQDPRTSYDVFVVGVGCGVDANAHLLTYQLVEAH